MTEKELITKIQELRQIKPRKEWVFLTKREILGEETIETTKFSWLEFFPRFLFQHKLAFVSLVLIGVVITTFGLSQNAVPGDLLFSLKKATEKAQTAFINKEEQPKVQLGLANKRLEELAKIAEGNQVKKLVPAIEECQASMSQAVKIAGNIKKPEEARKLVPEIKKLEGNIQNLKTYGVEISDTENTENIYKSVVDVLIKDLETRTLTEEQQKLLTEAKETQEAGDYPNTLSILMQIQPVPVNE
jgi:chaperonin cofactor prefoldin